MEDIFDDAAELLRRAIKWEVPATRWARIGDVVAAMESALAGADPWTRVSEQAAELALLGPYRVSTRLGDRPVVPAPPEIRERINKLISQLVREPRIGEAAGNTPRSVRPAEPDS